MVTGRRAWRPNTDTRLFGLGKNDNDHHDVSEDGREENCTTTSGHTERLTPMLAVDTNPKTFMREVAEWWGEVGSIRENQVHTYTQYSEEARLYCMGLGPR